MRKFIVSVLALAPLALCACQENAPYAIKTICPSGAPAFAFYDQDADSFKTDVASNVSKELLGIDYDGVVFDSINGLNLIKKNNAGFKLARFITGGNFYLVSYDKAEGETPSAGDTFISFNEGALPDLVYKKLSASYSAWSTWDMPSPTYVADTATVSAALIAHEYDYYFIAEPSLFAAKKQMGDNASKVKVLANLKASWSDYSGQPAIPQAALFVRTAAYEAHTTEFTSYLSELDARKDILKNEPATMKSAIETAYPEQSDQKARFGVPAAIAFNVQKDSNNGLGIIGSDEITDNASFMNDFVDALGNPKYSSFNEGLFI